MKRYIIWCKNHPKSTIVILGLITLFFGINMFNLEVDSTVDGMIIKNNPDYHFYQQIKKEFISDITSIVFIRDKNIFSEKKLKLIEKAFYEFESIPGVIKIDGIINSKNFIWENGALNTDRLITHVPEESEHEQFQKIKINAFKNPLVYRNLISKDGSAIAVNIISDNTSDEHNFNLRITREIDKIMEKNFKGNFEEYFQLGTPYTRTLISKFVIHDILYLIPISVILILVMLIMILKDWHGGIIPTVAGIISLIWTLGFMPLFGIKIQILTGMAPAVIIALGCTFDIHFLTEYYEAVEKGHVRGEAVEYIASHKGLALLLSGMSTLLGCISIVFNDITLLHEFGIVIFWGTLSNFLISCAIDPVYLLYYGPKISPKSYRKDYKQKPIWSKISSAFAHVALNQKKITIGSVVVIILIFIYGSSKIRLDNDLLGYFKYNSVIRQNSRLNNDLISGSQVFYIILTADKKDTFKDPENMRIIQDIQNFIKTEKIFDFTLSLADHVAYVEREMNEGKKDFYIIPDSKNLVAQHLLLYHSSDLDRYINFDYNRTNIIVRHNITSSYELKERLAQLDHYVHGKYANLDIRYTGENILFLNAADTMSSGLAQSVAFVIVTVFLIVSFLYRNILYGLFSVLQNFFQEVFVYGLFGFIGIPLNVGTNMIANITIGVSVDDTIHLMTRYHKGYHKGLTMKKRNLIAAKVLGTEIRPMMVTSLALTIGFVLLGISDFIPIIQFGVFSGLVLFIAVYCDCIVTPSLLTFIKFGKKPDLNGLE